MKKINKLIAILLVAVCVLSGCAGSNTGKQEETVTMRATVTSFEKAGFLVTPEDGSEELKSSDSFYISSQYLPDKLEKQIAFMESTGAKFSATGYGWMDEAGNNLHTVFIPPKKTDYKKCIRLSDPIGNLTVMYDQSALGKFEVPIIKKRNDFALWLQILKKTDYCYGMDDVLGTYRVGRSGSVSKNKFQLVKYHWQLYHKIEGHNVVRSLYELGCWAWVKGTGIGLDKRKV